MKYILIAAIAVMVVVLGWALTRDNEGAVLITPSVSPEPTPTPTVTSTATPRYSTPAEISRANQTRKEVVFTFDAGAGIQSADAILNILKKYNTTGTFFLTGAWADKNPEITRRIAREGHEIYNHTYTHPHLKSLSDAEIAVELQKTEETIKLLVGRTTKPYFRPPFGERDVRVLAAAGQAGYQSIYWTADALDWKPEITAEEVKSRIYNNLKPGAIYLMHIGDDITGQILDEVFSEIKRQGYSLVSLTEGLKP